MPATAPAPSDPIAPLDLQALGDRVRKTRKSLSISAETLARAANLSRQTLHRIEKGEASVTIGAYVNALRALGLTLTVQGDPLRSQVPGTDDAVRLADYPQLKQLVWHRQADTLTAQEALAIYERNWRHVDPDRLEPAERTLIEQLVKRHGQGVLLV
jgi:transcriptional regulator with XRE-family HTH domain